AVIVHRRAGGNLSLLTERMSKAAHDKMDVRNHVLAMTAGSRLSAVRASEDHAVREVLGVGAFDEEDLYAALEFLAKPQGATEAALAGRRRARSFSTT
ncbi:MAG: hypothetical protein N2438_10070, partial [Limisphaera sp.]|nr:hypothetical protein [Limisphaera sp.]